MNQSLEHRLNRAIGQLEGIKKQVSKDEDCVKVLQQLKAVIQSLKKFGEAYVDSHFESRIEDKINDAEFKKKFKELIALSFYL
ncbi:metal-sensitive transcriptional regulator [bacterium]|nr:metal-sensitive transcriptional regulator [bacterium]